MPQVLQNSHMANELVEIFSAKMKENNEKNEQRNANKVYMP